MSRARQLLANLCAAAALAAAPMTVLYAEANGTVLVPAGSYTPFLRLKAPNAAAASRPNVVAIEAFRLDAEPVTNAQFLAFVTAHPEWRKSTIKPLFADQGYLKRWPGDLMLPDTEAKDEPVTDVSWFAAQAYCRARGMRLPTTAQWEYALADDGRGQAAVRAQSLAWFSKPNAARPGLVGGAPNGFGVRDLVGLVWEWTLDFDAFATTAESRDPNGKSAGFVCGGAAAGASDPSDYPGFMRFSMRASLKAAYTADNVGFRCAGGAP